MLDTQVRTLITQVMESTSHAAHASHAGHVDNAVCLHHEGQKHEQVHHKEKHTNADNSTHHAQQNLSVFNELTLTVVLRVEI